VKQGVWSCFISTNANIPFNLFHLSAIEFLRFLIYKMEVKVIENVEMPTPLRTQGAEVS